MNRKLSIPWILLLLILVGGCGPTVYYLGDTYESSNSLQVFYDEEEVEGPYTVMGKMTTDKSRKYKPEPVKEKMIRKAQQYGADAIIFSDFYVMRLESEKEDRLVIKAKLVRFYEEE